VTSLTYEVGDTSDRDRIRRVAVCSAEIFMGLLLGVDEELFAEPAALAP
jgi:hypothetical protein